MTSATRVETSAEAAPTLGKANAPGAESKIRNTITFDSDALSAKRRPA